MVVERYNSQLLVINVRSGMDKEGEVRKERGGGK